MLLQGLGADNPIVVEFEEQIDLFRRLVFGSSYVELLRYDGELEGELGLRVRKNCLYEYVRASIPGFVTEITDSVVWSRLKTEGYSSLLADGKRR